MKDPVVALIRKSAVTKKFLKKLSKPFSKNNVLIKIIPDDEFNVMMSINTVDEEIDIDDETFLIVARAAHENDITINQMLNRILKEQIENLEKDESIQVAMHKCYMGSSDFYSELEKREEKL